MGLVHSVSAKITYSKCYATTAKTPHISTNLHWYVCRTHLLELTALLLLLFSSSSLFEPFWQFSLCHARLKQPRRKILRTTTTTTAFKQKTTTNFRSHNNIDGEHMQKFPHSVFFHFIANVMDWKSSQTADVSFEMCATNDQTNRETSINNEFSFSRQLCPSLKNVNKRLSPFRKWSCVLSEKND